MGKKDLFHKVEDTEQLEMIIEKKSFSVDVKNLLLNMLYKIQNSYNDYETVKRLVSDKKSLVEEILHIISDCENIEIIEPSSKKKSDKTKLKVDQEKKSIIVEPNEKTLLYALYSLPIEKRVYLSEEYSSLRNALPSVLQEGENIHKAEIIRDFDAWSWNTIYDEIQSIESNIIYQNLLILLGKEFIQEWMDLERTKNSIELLNEKLELIFGELDTKKFMKLIFKLVIILYCSKDKKEQKRLTEELELNTNELEKLSNTQTLVEELSNKKTKCLNKIKQIDQLLNDKKQLQTELKKENKKEKNKEEPLTEEDLIERLKKQRKKLSKEMKDANRLLDPKNFVKTKTEIEQQNEILSALKEYDKKAEYLLDLQKYFIKGLNSKIEKTSDKKELMELVYLIRYYNFIPYFDNAFIKDVAELKNMINETEESLIEKLMTMKMVSTFSNNAKFDKKLIKNVFKMRLMNLENIYLQFEKGEKIRIVLYDVETVEKGFEISNKDIKIAKYNKKIKMFI